MHVALLALLCSAIVTALPGDEAPEKWGGPRGGNKISHVGNNIGNGHGGGLNIDTGGGNIGCIGIGVGLGCVTTVCPTTVTTVTSGYGCGGVFQGGCGGPEGGFTSYCATLAGEEISTTNCCACAAASFSCSTTGNIFTSAPYAFDCGGNFPMTTATITTVTATPCVTMVATQPNALLDTVEDVPGVAGILKVV